MFKIPRNMPKYIFKINEYATWDKAEYEDHHHVEYTGRKYNQTKVRGFSLPGECDAKEKYGYSSGMWIGVNSFAPGGVYEAHKHQTPQMYYVTSGRARVRVGDEERVVEEGAWVFTPAGIVHYLKNIGKKPFTYIMMGGNPDYGEFRK